MQRSTPYRTIHTLCQRYEDRLRDPFGIGKNFIVPDPHHLPPLSFQPLGALLIIRIIGMLPAISFDDQHPFDAREVGDERSHRMLSPKLMTVRTAASQQRPQPSLRIGHIGS